MECYSYVNIFETKGLEYVLVVFFLLSLALLVRWLTKTPKSADVRPAELVFEARPATRLCTADFHCPYGVHDLEGSMPELVPIPQTD